MLSVVASRYALGPCALPRVSLGWDMPITTVVSGHRRLSASRIGPYLFHSFHSASSLRCRSSMNCVISFASVACSGCISLKSSSSLVAHYALLPHPMIIVLYQRVTRNLQDRSSLSPTESSSGAMYGLHYLSSHVQPYRS